MACGMASGFDPDRMVAGSTTIHAHPNNRVPLAVPAVSLHPTIPLAQLSGIAAAIYHAMVAQRITAQAMTTSPLTSLIPLNDNPLPRHQAEALRDRLL